MHPSSTDCCPVTPTKTVTPRACQTCITGCVIPTETITVTTGCKPTLTVNPPPTSLTVIRPTLTTIRPPLHTAVIDPILDVA